ncbi:MAG: alpha/beta hydrolase [Rhodanobacter sp.]
MSRNFRPAWTAFALVALVLPPLATLAQSAALRQQLAQRQEQPSVANSPVSLPPGSRVLRDVAYGSDPRQRYDVYLPARTRQAPVIFMVHGGGWRRGDKAAPGVVQNKIDRWLPRGFIVISTNYRLLPDNAPLQQAHDVARALADAQRRAASWDADPHAFILMGHSAGAHLIALLSADPSLARAQGAQSWLGTIALDSASLDVEQIMQARHLPLYDEAFGSQASTWLALSPYQQMRGRIVPFLAVCSSRRQDSCPQARAFVRKAKSLGARASVLEEDLRHGEINAQLGLPSAYTRAVEHFMGSLSPSIARRLDQTAASVAALPLVISR